MASKQVFLFKLISKIKMRTYCFWQQNFILAMHPRRSIGKARLPVVPVAYYKSAETALPYSCTLCLEQDIPSISKDPSSGPGHHRQDQDNSWTDLAGIQADIVIVSEFALCFFCLYAPILLCYPGQLSHLPYSFWR